MIQNIGGFLVLSWLWLNRSKEPEVTVTEREPFVPVVAPGKGWSLDAEEEEALACGTSSLMTTGRLNKLLFGSSLYLTLLKKVLHRD